MNPEQEEQTLDEQSTAEPDKQYDSVLSSSEESEPVSKNVVILIVLAIIVVVLALMYLWGSHVSRDDGDRWEDPHVPAGMESELSALEAELNIPELDTLDAELDDLEADLDAVLVE